MSLDGRSLPDLVAAEGDPGRVQRVQLMGVTDVNLRDLAGLPALRSIRVAARPATGEHVGLALPAGAPVELLDVAAGRFEPGQLAGAPDLKFLTLSGNREPVRIAELAAVPGLLRLDLSGADVADLPAISALPALRVLTLNGDQWDSLLRSGWDPRGLAAAELAGSRTDAQEDAFRRAFAPRR
jgi:Leucine-rich repeat (LRR) protein